MSINPDQVLAKLQAIAESLATTAKVQANAFPQQAGTATSATGGSASLPANPVGFLTVTLPNGTSVKVPYYGG